MGGDTTCLDTSVSEVDDAVSKFGLWVRYIAGFVGWGVNGDCIGWGWKKGG